MKNKQAIQQLLENLEPDPSNVTTIRSSRCQCFVNEEDDAVAEFNAEECEKVLQSPESVKDLWDALGKPEDLTIELYGVEIRKDVKKKLEDICEILEEY
jgi:hypothetical protein